MHGLWYQYLGGNLCDTLSPTAGSTEDAVVLTGQPDGKLSWEVYWPPSSSRSYGCCLSLWVENPANQIDPAKTIAIFILLVKGFLIEGFMDGLQEEPMNCLKFMQNCEYKCGVHFLGGRLLTFNRI